MSPQYCLPLMPKQTDGVRSKFWVNHLSQGHMCGSPAGKLRFESPVPLFYKGVGSFCQGSSCDPERAYSLSGWKKFFVIHKNTELSKGAVP